MICVLGIWWWKYTPSAASILRSMTVNAEGFSHNKVQYELEWQEGESEYSGMINQIAAQYNKRAPFNTHHVVVTTEDFSNPDKVKINAMSRFGHVSWLMQSGVKGTLRVLHLVPKDGVVLKKIQALKKGQEVSFVVQEETDGFVPNSKDRGYSFGSKSSGHILVWVTDVRVK